MGKDSQGARTGIHRYTWGYMGSCISATNPRTDGMSQTGKSHCGLILPLCTLMSHKQQLNSNRLQR